MLNFSILIGCYKPKNFLVEQLDSIQYQTHQAWSVFLSDDSPSGAWQSEYSERLNKLGAEISRGPKIGFANNFLSLVRNPKLKSDLYAFCDQDDIWHPDKLEHGLKHLIDKRSDLPSLYCGATRYVSQAGDFIQNSYIFKRSPGIENALVQCIAGGNTMIFNRQAAISMARTPEDIELFYNDYLYQVEKDIKEKLCKGKVLKKFNVLK